MGASLKDVDPWFAKYEDAKDEKDSDRPSSKDSEPSIKKESVANPMMPFTVGAGVGASFFGKAPDLTDFQTSRSTLSRSNIGLTEAELAVERARQNFNLVNKATAAEFGPDFFKDLQAREAIRRYQTPMGTPTTSGRELLGRFDETGAGSQGRVSGHNTMVSDLAAKAREGQSVADVLASRGIVPETRPFTGAFAPIPGSTIYGPNRLVNETGAALTAEQARRALAEAELMQAYRPYEQGLLELEKARAAQVAAARETAKAAPGALSEVATVAGKGKYIPKLAGALSGMGLALNTGEAVERASKGDISGSALAGTGAALDAMSMLPLRPNKNMLMAKGIGTIGALLHPLAMTAHDKYKEDVLDKLEKLGLYTRPSVMDRVR